MTTAIQITVMSSNQISESGQVLSRAFWDDPMTMYLMPDEKRRAKGLPWFMTLAARYGHKFGEVHTTAGTVEGDAIWLPPGETTIPTMRMVTNGILSAPFAMGLGATKRFLTMMDVFDHLHEEAMPDRHWYLMVLGVDTPRQGQGVGGALLAPVLARADADGLPCYLETQKAKNLPFYQKHGFEIVIEDDLPGNALHYWTMKRAPRG